MAVNGSGIYGTREWTVTGEEATQSVAKKDGQTASKSIDTCVPKDAVNNSTSVLTIPDLRFTSKGNSVYIFARSWKEANLRVKALSSSKEKVNHVTLLGAARKPEWRQEQADLFVSLADTPKTDVPVYTVRASLSSS